MTTHTPGPWTNHGRIKQAGLPHSSVAAKTLIARVYSEAFGDSEQETANACLISAAPDLLEIVQELLADEDEQLAQIAGFVEALGIDPVVKARMDKMRAAIAKATGTA